MFLGIYISFQFTYSSKSGFLSYASQILYVYIDFNALYIPTSYR